jgi:hypothetical protein
VPRERPAALARAGRTARAEEAARKKGRARVCAAGHAYGSCVASGRVRRRPTGQQLSIRVGHRTQTVDFKFFFGLRAHIDEKEKVFKMA